MRRTIREFDDNKKKMVRKPKKKDKKNPVGCTGENKRRKANFNRNYYRIILFHK